MLAGWHKITAIWKQFWIFLFHGIYTTISVPLFFLLFIHRNPGNGQHILFHVPNIRINSILFSLPFPTTFLKFGRIFFAELYPSWCLILARKIHHSKLKWIIFIWFLLYVVLRGTFWICLMFNHAGYLQKEEHAGSMRMTMDIFRRKVHRTGIYFGIPGEISRLFF